MSYAADILASTLQDLLPGYEELFTKFHPFPMYIQKSGGFNKRKLKGPWVEFNVLTGGPGDITGVRGGSETLASIKRNNLYRGKEYPHRFIYHFNVPNKELDEAETEYDFANLVETYPEQGLADAWERLNAQVVRGASSAGTDDNGGNLEGILTFNGDQTYTPQSTLSTRTGVFTFSATQTSTVHDLPKEDAGSNPTTGWRNQYEHISSFSTEGRKKLRTCRDAANRQGRTPGGYVNLMLGDVESYQNYIDDLDDQVQTAMVDLKGEKVPDGFREGVKFGKADFFADDHIDITDTTAFTTASAQQGVIYLLNTQHWEMFFLGKKGGMFDVQKPILLPDQDAVQYRIVSYFNFFCKNLRAQGVVTGGANI